MAIGTDTGFFIELGKGNKRAEEIWDKVSVGDEALVVSVISINELLGYFYRKGKSAEAEKYANLLKLMPNITLLSVSSRLAELSARYKHGLGLSTVDSIIITTFLQEGVRSIITTDSDMKKVEPQMKTPVELLAT